jgi:hypothetical protein
VYPIKAGGYTGATEPKVVATESEIMQMTPELKQQVLETSAEDVRTAYQLFVPANLAGMLATFVTEERERTDPEVAARRGKTYTIQQVSGIKVKRLSVVLPDGSEMPLDIKEITPLGKGGAVRVWLYDQPFSSFSASVVQEMVRQGAGMVGITFSDPVTEQAFTLGRTPRKTTTTVCPTSERYSPEVREKCYERAVTSRLPTVRGGSGEINVINEKIREIRAGATKEQIYKVEDGKVYVFVEEAFIPETEVDPTSFTLSELHYTNVQGEHVDRPEQLVLKSGYTRAPFWRQAHWRQVGVVPT